jgi:hypothetical protein
MTFLSLEAIYSGQLQWVVKEKVTAYEQNLILFCPVENCCSEPAGWSVGPKSIILDVKTFSNDPKVKIMQDTLFNEFFVALRNMLESNKTRNIYLREQYNELLAKIRLLESSKKKSI